MKTLRCSDVGFDCAAVVTAETVEEVLAQAAGEADCLWGLPDGQRDCTRPIAAEWMTIPDWITHQVLTHVEQQARKADLAALRNQYAYLLEQEGNGLEVYQLLAYIRRWGSITIAEACALLDLTPQKVQELLDWLAARLEGESSWSDTSPLTGTRTRQGRVYFSQEEQTPEPSEPMARRSKDQKQRDAARRYRRRRRPSAR